MIRFGMRTLDAFARLMHGARNVHSGISADAAVREAHLHVVRTYGYHVGLPEVSLLEFNPLLDEVIDPYSFLEGQAQPTDIALLKGLARQFPACRYFEIGSWRGESLANVAGVAGECVSLSLSPDEMRMMKMTEQFIAQHHFFSRNLPNVSYLAHNSHTLDFSPYEHSFDLIFIDGDHSRRGVTLDTRNALRLLRDDRSIIVWHDYGQTSERVDWSVLAGILDGCPRELHRYLYHVSHTLCVIFTRQTLAAHFRTFPRSPETTFGVRIDARRHDSTAHYTVPKEPGW